MNSTEEDALFESYGWTKNLIARRYEAPCSEITLGFDSVVALTSTPVGEARLREVVVAYGQKVRQS